MHGVSAFPAKGGCRTSDTEMHNSTGWFFFLPILGALGVEVWFIR